MAAQEFQWLTRTAPSGMRFFAVSYLRNGTYAARASLVAMEAVVEKVKGALGAWAKANPRVRRVWLFGSDSKRNARGDTDVDIAIEMEPVPDSEETLSYWIAHAEEWQAELEQRIGSNVDLEWFDPDVDAPLGDKAVLVYDRTAA
jgi:predicted nucleotidyltransferase